VSRLQEQVLEATARHGLKGVILDISAVDTLDSYFARALAETAQMVALMGGRTVVAGMRPSVAITTIQLGITLGGVMSALDVDRALDLLEAVNRLMDDLEIASPADSGQGTHISCTRWLRACEVDRQPCPLDLGVATRAHRQMDINGDAFIIKRSGNSALAGVIDGLGHGQLTHRAALTARHYIENHYDSGLESIFRGVARSCRATRGVVMALARLDWAARRLTFASVGNIEARVLGGAQRISFVVRRGVIGANAPSPAVTEHPWDSSQVLVLHSDGVKPGWSHQEFLSMAGGSAAESAQRLLRARAREDDDATVVVVKEI